MAMWHHKPEPVFTNPVPPYYRSTVKPGRQPTAQDDASSYRSAIPAATHARPRSDPRRSAHTRHVLGPPSQHSKTCRGDPPPLQHRSHHYQYPPHHIPDLFPSPLRPTRAPTPSFVGTMSKDKFMRVLATFLDIHAGHNQKFISLPTYAEPESVFFSVSRPEIPTTEYVKRLVTYTECSPAAFVVMMVYLDRIAEANGKLRVTPFNMHRLLVAALTLSCKMLDDRCFSNVHYAKVGGIPTAKEMNRLELQFMKYVDYHLHVDPHTYNQKHVSLEHQLPLSPVSLFEGATALSSGPDLDDVHSMPVPANYACGVTAPARMPTRHRSAPITSHTSHMTTRTHHTHAPAHPYPHMQPIADPALAEWYGPQVSTTSTTASKSSYDTHYSHQSSQHQSLKSKELTP